MKTFNITANGMDMGNYEGESADDAVLHYVETAGYGSLEDAADACNQTVEEFLSDISVSEVQE